MRLSQVRKLLHQVETIGEVEVKERPWGRMYYLTVGELQLKVIECDDGKRTSLQFHNEKDEVIVPLDGDGYVLAEDCEGSSIDRVSVDERPGLPIRIPPKRVHQVVGPLLYLEVETNDRDLDTVRIDDDYGRAGT